MNQAAIETLIAREEAMIAALDGGDAAALEQATYDMRDAIAEVASAGGWREQRDLRDIIARAIRLAEAAGGRINFLADRNRQRLDRLAALAGQPRAIGYKRSGRYA